MLAAQTPAINRILAFTYTYDASAITYVLFQSRTNEGMISSGNSITLKGNKEGKIEIDTSLLVMPAFILNEKKRSDLMSDLDNLKSQRDNLDPEIYIAFERVLDFFNYHPIPNLNDNLKIEKSTWQKEEIRKLWNERLLYLRELCIQKIEKFRYR